MRILFMGTPEFALPSLKILLEHRYEVPAVVTAPDKPRGRGQGVSFTPIKELALERHLPVLQPESLKDPQFLAQISSLHVDVIVVVAFRILPRELFTLPKLGSFNLHASLLPKYRGAAPINWAIINGEQESGVTTFFLQEKVDTGSILLQARVKIGPDETAGELHDKLADVGAEIVLQTVRLMELGKTHPRSQDNSQASAAPKIFKEDCKIDWNKPAREIHNHVRGLSPIPCAWTTHARKQLKIYRTAVGTTEIIKSDGRAGEIMMVGPEALLVRTADGVLSILEIQQEGRRRMEVDDFLRGYEFAVGDRLE